MSVRDYNTKYGVIHVTDPGPTHEYDNINVYKQTPTRYVKLQGPALRAFKAAEQRITPRRWKKKNRTRHILITGQGYRDFGTQSELYRSDPGRYANPNYSMHVEGLAIDVDQGQGAFRLYQIKKALLLEGWHYGVSGEPWHASYTVTG